MKFEIVKAGGTKQIGYKAKTETIHIEDWVEKDLNPNKLHDEIDSLWDMCDDIVRGEDGVLYIAAKIYQGNEHYGEYGIWAEVVEAEI